MPIYEFKCNACAHIFDDLVPMNTVGDLLTCPTCGQVGARRLVSAFAAHGLENGHIAVGRKLTGVDAGAVAAAAGGGAPAGAATGAGADAATGAATGAGAGTTTGATTATTTGAGTTTGAAAATGAATATASTSA